MKSFHWLNGWALSGCLGCGLDISLIPHVKFLDRRKYNFSRDRFFLVKGIYYTTRYNPIGVGMVNV